MPNNESPTRRDFLVTAATLSAALGGAPGVFSQNAPAPSASPNERVGVGYIGVGGRAGAHIQAVDWLKGQKKMNIDGVAVCDVYRPRLEGAAKRFPAAKSYTDFRDLLKDPNVDIVVIATPDHHHPYQVAEAAKAGKHIFCEKPFTHWRQFDAMKQAVAEVRKNKVVFQLGTQGMSDQAWHDARKLIQQGVIGQPIHAECGMFRDSDFGERGMHIPDGKARPGADLDWSAFLGDAPKRDFDVSRFFRWRLYEDYSGGPVTDVYPHTLTPVAFMMNAGFPSHVVAAGGVYRWPERDVPDSFNLMADYPEKMTICVLGTFGSGYNGGDGIRGAARSPVVRGWDGALIFKGREIQLIPNQGKKAQTFPVARGEDFIAHWENFLDCVRRKDPAGTFSPIELAYKVQTTLIMSAWSLKQRKVAKWDAEKEQIVMS